MMWIEDTTNKILYNCNGGSVFMQVENVLSLKSGLYAFEKEYADTAAASVKYAAFRAAIISAGGTIVTP